MPYLCDRVREVATKNGNKLVMNAFQSIGDLPGLIEKSSGGGGATTYYYVTLGKNDTIEKTEILMASSEKMGEILELVKKNPDQVRNKESFGKSVGVVAT